MCLRVIAFARRCVGAPAWATCVRQTPNYPVGVQKSLILIPTAKEISGRIGRRGSLMAAKAQAYLFDRIV